MFNIFFGQINNEEEINNENAPQLLRIPPEEHKEKMEKVFLDLIDFTDEILVQTKGITDN